jgi:hypothetical protein
MHNTADAFLQHVEDSRQWRNVIVDEIQSKSLHTPYYDDIFTPSRLEQVGLGPKSKTFAKMLSCLLEFQGREDRHDRIPEAHQQTFEWIFRDPGSNASWTNFSDWLQSRSQLYWISGKPGSGKSTMMKFLCHHAKTQELLAQSSPVPVVMSAFFFWNSGRAMQMSQMGLVQSLLHEMLSQCEEYAPIAFPDLWEMYVILGHPPAVQWTWDELVRAFRRLIENVGTSKKFYYLIDGLDEYSGAHADLIEFLNEVLQYPNVKMCVSSRPWVVFEDAFKSHPSLHVHELTYGDIRTYITTHFDESEGFKELQVDEEQYASALVDQITRKSSGVFLWVALVVRSLLSGLSNGDRVLDLQQRLDDLPDDLENLFDKILFGLDPAYKHQASHFFQLYRASRRPLTIMDLAYADECDVEHALRCDNTVLSQEQIQSKILRARRRLNSRCKGLLEVARKDQLSPASLVQYLHRTVKDCKCSHEMKHSKSSSRPVPCWHPIGPPQFDSGMSTVIAEALVKIFLRTIADLALSL